MADIDVSDILIDSDVITGFSVIRRKEKVNDHGRLVVESYIIPNLVGVITFSDPNSADNGPDYRINPRTISVISNYPLLGSIKGYQPDVIVWEDNHYVITEILPYRNYGIGFYESICTSIEKVDAMILPGYLGCAFHSPFNTQYLPILC